MSHMSTTYHKKNEYDPYIPHISSAYIHFACGQVSWTLSHGLNTTKLTVTLENSQTGETLLISKYKIIDKNNIEIAVKDIATSFLRHDSIYLISTARYCVRKAA